MTDKVEFLYKAAAELRAIASAAPGIAEELRRMAEELEETAAEFARARRDRFGRADAP